MLTEYFENVEEARIQIDHKIWHIKQVLDKRQLELNWNLDNINSGITNQTKIAKIRIDWVDKEVCKLIKTLGNIEIETIQDKTNNGNIKMDNLFRFWGIKKGKNEPIKESDYMTMKRPKKRSKSTSDITTTQYPNSPGDGERVLPTAPTGQDLYTLMEGLNKQVIKGDNPTQEINEYKEPIGQDVDDYKPIDLIKSKQLIRKDISQYRMPISQDVALYTQMFPINSKTSVKRSISTKDINEYKTYQEDMRKSLDFTDEVLPISPGLESNEFKWKSEELLNSPIYEVIDEKYFTRERKLWGTLGSKRKREVKKEIRILDLPVIATCTQGKRLGQLDKPKGVAVSENGRIFVAEKVNNRIQVFTSEAKYISSFGEKSGPNKMQGPYGVCIRKDAVYVTLTNQHAIQMYTTEGVFIKQKGREGREDGRLKLPTGIDCDKSRGKVFVCDTGNNRIQIFDKELKFIKVLHKIKLDRPLDIKVVRYGDFYVLDRSQSCVHLFNSLGELQAEVIDTIFHINLLNPLYLTISPEDYIILSDYSNHCIHLFSSGGELMWTLGDEGKGKPLEEPRGVACDSRGRLITVCNKKKDALQIFQI
ncbi:PEP-CTERM domain protein [Oopsacas minuta]|uniref:PEP-CTERM domain protein n=1 Tax=Oopsacas minuta TaxID=111878 RepID=A0AAV7JJS3_9METZ|nr:PEP-CTERM domain protein [Oopsacas minuta]